MRLSEERRAKMKPFTGNRWYGLAAAGTLALTVASASASADDFERNLGPVGPNEPILTSVGSKQVIAFYEANGGRCGMNIVVWDRADQSGSSAARVRVTLNPREVVHIDSVDNKSLDLQCGEYAAALAIVDTANFITAGAAQ
jgi:ABC-type phosphate transport system substrate-binding protein